MNDSQEKLTPTIGNAMIDKIFKEKIEYNCYRKWSFFEDSNFLIKLLKISSDEVVIWQEDFFSELEKNQELRYVFSEALRRDRTKISVYLKDSNKATEFTAHKNLKVTIISQDQIKQLKLPKAVCVVDGHISRVRLSEGDSISKNNRRVSTLLERIFGKKVETHDIEPYIKVSFKSKSYVKKLKSINQG